MDHPWQIFAKAWVIIPAMMWLASSRAGLWHELGHALRARMTGMGVVKFTLGGREKIGGISGVWDARKIRLANLFGSGDDARLRGAEGGAALRSVVAAVRHFIWRWAWGMRLALRWGGRRCIVEGMHPSGALGWALPSFWVVIFSWFARGKNTGARPNGSDGVMVSTLWRMPAERMAGATGSGGFGRSACVGGTCAWVGCGVRARGSGGAGETGRRFVFWNRAADG